MLMHKAYMNPLEVVKMVTDSFTMSIDKRPEFHVHFDRGFGAAAL